MSPKNLTDAGLRGLRHEHGEIVDIKSGLIVRATQAGIVHFSFRYRSGAVRRRIIIGRYPAVSLADARAKAGQIREQVRSGADPQGDRRQRQALTFDGLADRYLANYAKPTKASWRDDEGHLRRARKPWGGREAAAISKQDVARFLFDLALRAPVAANRTRSVLLKMYGWAIDSALLDVNPVLGTKKPHKEGRGKSRTLSDPEIALIWHALTRPDVKATPGIIAALQCLLLLGQRPGEIAGMAVDELHDLDDPAAAIWVIGAHRMKARKVHVVPLPPLARQVIAAAIARQARPECVFASKYHRERPRLARNSLSEALARLIEGLDDGAGASLKRVRATPHDLRRTVATGMSKLGIPRDDRLAVLAHVYTDTHATYDHFDRLPQKRAALEAWERHLRKLIAIGPGAEIVPLHRRGGR